MGRGETGAGEGGGGGLNGGAWVGTVRHDGKEEGPRSIQNQDYFTDRRARPEGGWRGGEKARKRRHS